jgi:hypothetical protein
MDIFSRCVAVIIIDHFKINISDLKIVENQSIIIKKLKEQLELFQADSIK